MRKTVTVPGVEIGSGMPKIAVPVVGKTREDILEQADRALRSAADLIEWRADHYYDILNPEAAAETLRLLRELLSSKPLLFSFRTAQEGGALSIPAESYHSLLAAACGSGMIDLIDCELMIGSACLASVIHTAHENGIPVIVSNHDFHATPAAGEIISRLKRMEDAGADIAKIAVMPNSPADVLALLSATEQASRACSVPLITMSMDVDGVISRLCGEEFGSAVTFGTAGHASAPGQIDAEELKRILMLLHRANA